MLFPFLVVVLRLLYSSQAQKVWGTDGILEAVSLPVYRSGAEDAPNVVAFAIGTPRRPSPDSEALNTSTFSAPLQPVADRSVRLLGLDLQRRYPTGQLVSVQDATSRLPLRS